MVVFCPHCKKLNKKTNIQCEFCATQLIDVNKISKIDIPTKKASWILIIFALLFVGPFLLPGILFLGVGLFDGIHEYTQTKGYEKTIATLKDYTNCTYNDECKAIYEYQVDGIIYTVSPDLLGNSDAFAKNDTVYYNPNNPSESIIYTGWNISVIIGLILIISALLPLVIIITITKIIIKASKGKDSVTMDAYGIK